MRPRSYATDEALASRRLAFEAGVGAGANPTGTIRVGEVKAELQKTDAGIMMGSSGARHALRSALHRAASWREVSETNEFNKTDPLRQASI